METLLIYDAARRRVADVVSCSEKSRNKSLERGELWVVDPRTSRVLPYQGGGVRYDRFDQRSAWWEVGVIDLAAGTSDGAAPGVESELAEDVPPAQEARHETVVSVDNANASRSAIPERASTAAAGASEVPPSDVSGPVLARLSALIAERRRTMPEGSYTTHLFSKGSDKIRKKAGEEAVELILARSNEELVGEAADLVYHLLVLLEAEACSIDDVIRELDRRHQKG